DRSALMTSILIGLSLQLALAQDGSPAAAATQPVNTAAALEQAYRKEFAYLKAEQQALKERLSGQRTDATQRIRKSEANISGLESRLLALEREANAVEGRILTVEDAAISAADAGELVDATVSQAGEALGIEVSDEATDSDRLAAVFDAAVAGLQASAAVRTDEGPFFLPDGTQVNGQRAFIGQVAAYGVSDRGQGSLLPIGDGRLQLRTVGGGEATAAALISGERPAAAELFLFESLDKPVTERAERTLADIMDGGGVIGWVIVILGLIALLMAAMRTVMLALSGRGGQVVEPVAEALAAGNLSAARALVADGATPIARVISAILADAGRDREAMQDIASEALLNELPAIERFGAIIIVVAAVAPLLGLLGTVTGMIATFEIITEFGTGDPKMLSGGISEALITTQLGLVVAIPAVLLGNILKGRADAVVARIERAALRVLNRLVDDDEDEDEDAARMASK
ncbi:MAG: biopolymer transport protein ExbB, partial [Myxococcota bacterium]